MSARDIIEATTLQLMALYGSREEAAHIAWLLLCALMNTSKAAIIAREELSLTPELEERLEGWLQKHIREHMPLQYILGSVPFLDLTIIVKSPVLIPRPETEEWCYALIERMKLLEHTAFKVLDLCTGSGCIALALAQAFKNAYVDAVDNADEALALAQENATYNHITNVHFLKSDLYSALDKHVPYDLIVANPPYISPQEYTLLEQSVTQWEDVRALIAQDEGMEIINKIIDQARSYMLSHNEMQALGFPQLIIEIGYTQGARVKQRMEHAGFKNVSILQDLAGKDRVVTGRL